MKRKLKSLDKQLRKKAPMLTSDELKYFIVNLELALMDLT